MVEFILEQIKPLVGVFESLGLACEPKIIDDQAGLIFGFSAFDADDAKLMAQRKYIKEKLHKFTEQLLGSPWVASIEGWRNYYSEIPTGEIYLIFHLMPEDKVWAEETMKHAIKRMEKINEAALD